MHNLTCVEVMKENILDLKKGRSEKFMKMNNEEVDEKDQFCKMLRYKVRNSI